MKHWSLWRIIGIAVFCGILAVFAWFNYQTKDKYINNKECPAVIAYSDPSANPQKIMVYDRDHGIREVARTINDKAKLNLIGYNDNLQAFLSNTSSYIAITNNEHHLNIKLTGIPNEHVSDTILRQGKLYSSWIYCGSLVVVCHNSNGQREYSHELSIPRPGIKHFGITNDVDISQNGMTAATLIPDRHYEAGIYVFDKKGQIVKRLSEGVYPLFDPTGKRIACRDMRFVDICGHAWRYKDNDRILVYDISTGSKRAYPIRPYWHIWENDMRLVGWTPDGKWLILSGRHGVYGLDLRSSSVKYCRFPLRLNPRRNCPDWNVIVLSQTPDLSTKHEVNHE